MFRQKQIYQAVLALCAGGFVAGVSAQQQTTGGNDQPVPPADQSQSLKKVEVTGSRIKRIDTETPSPVSVITREQIERSGALSVSEVLKRAPSANAGSFDENATAGSYTPGAASASLRGLGPQATLVLIDGRRVAPFGFASGGQTTFVDINQIPIDVVERIEILLDGASAIYGSDAIGGVINVILRHDYNGFQVAGSAGESTHGDGFSKDGSLTYGHGSLASDGYNFFVNYQHIDQQPVLASSREATATSNFTRFGLADYRSSYSYPGNLYTTGGAFIGPNGPCPTTVNDPTSSLNGRCVYDQVRYTDLVVKSQRDSVTAAGTLDLSRGFELFADGTIGRTSFKQQSASYNDAAYNPYIGIGSNYIDLPPNHPQNPTGTDDVLLRYRFSDVPSLTKPTSDTQRAVVGVRNSDLYGWDVESGILYSHSRTTIDTTGIINLNVYANEVLMPGTNVANNSFYFGDPSKNDPGLMSRLYPTLKDVGTTSTSSIDLRGTRDIFSLPAGPVGIATGIELRHEKFESIPDPLKTSGAVFIGASESSGGRTIGAAYAELSAPLFKGFEASLAARVDHYSDFGTTTNPKIGFKWKLLPSLALRSTYATGFRAPAITELSTTPTTGYFNGVQDPKLCATYDANNPNCSVSLPATISSNPHLQPEKSKNFNAGVIFEPVDSLSVAFDAFKIKQRDTITYLSPDYLLAHESEYPGFVVRNPDGTLNSLNISYANLGDVQLWGYDIDVKGQQNIGEIGKFGLSLSYDHEPSFKAASLPGAPLLQYAGTYSQPKDRMRVGFSFDRGPWTSSLTFNYTGKYSLRQGPESPACPFEGASNSYLCEIESFLTTDLYVGYKGFKNLELSLTIKNLDNRQAPLDETFAGGYYTFYNSSFHDAMGRYFQVGAKYTFW